MTIMSKNNLSFKSEKDLEYFLRKFLKSQKGLYLFPKIEIPNANLPDMMFYKKPFFYAVELKFLKSRFSKIPLTPTYKKQLITLSQMSLKKIETAVVHQYNYCDFMYFIERKDIEKSFKSTRLLNYYIRELKRVI